MTDKSICLGFCVVFGVFACSSSNELRTGSGNGGNGGGALSEPGGESGSALSIPGTGGGVGSLLTDASPGDCSPTAEVCDGKDNDCDGIVDNVDTNKDGVCDCLSIATVGYVGTWGKGNVFASWLNARTPKPATNLADQVLTDELLAPFQVIVFLSTSTAEILGDNGKIPALHAFSDSEAQAFKKWVQSGGGAMATIGYNYGGKHEEDNINKLFSTIGLTYKTNGYVAGAIENWIANPVSQGIKKINTTNGVECSGDGTVIATVSPTSKTVAMQIGESAMGRAVMWGDEWITYDQLWEDVQDEQVERLWLNIFKYLTPPKQCQVPIPANVR